MVSKISISSFSPQEDLTWGKWYLEDSWHGAGCWACEEKRNHVFTVEYFPKHALRTYYFHLLAQRH